MKIYVAMCNADMIEGRGPMVMDKIFLHKNHANAYIDSKPGVMGRKAKWSQEKYGDWEVKEYEVLEYDFVEAKRVKEELQKTALNKLTKEEKEALDLL